MLGVSLRADGHIVSSTRHALKMPSPYVHSAYMDGSDATGQREPHSDWPRLVPAGPDPRPSVSSLRPPPVLSLVDADLDLSWAWNAKQLGVSSRSSGADSRRSRLPPTRGLYIEQLAGPSPPSCLSTAPHRRCAPRSLPKPSPSRARFLPDHSDRVAHRLICSYQQCHAMQFLTFR